MMAAFSLATSLCACGHGSVENDAQDEVQKVIGPAGGVLSSADGRFYMVIPPRALTDEITFTMAPARRAPAGAVGVAYEIGPSGTTFDQPALLVMTPGPDERAAVLRGELAIATAVGEQWVAVAGADDVDDLASADAVLGRTHHLSIYAAVSRADDKCPSEKLEVRGGWHHSNGRWIIPEADLALSGAAHSIKHEPAVACTGQDTPGAKVLESYLLAQFPGTVQGSIYHCEFNADGWYSLHSEGRAIDLMIPVRPDDDHEDNDNVSSPPRCKPASGPDDEVDADNAVGDPIARWLMEHAQEIGIQLLIWDNSIWQADGHYVMCEGAPASTDGRENRLYCKTSPHDSHIHIELTKAGAAMLTPWFPHPDLTITELWWEPASPRPGDDVRFNVRVVNQGEDPTPPGVTIGVRYSVDGTDLPADDSDDYHKGWGARGAPGSGVPLEMTPGEVDPRVGAGRAGGSLLMRGLWHVPAGGGVFVIGGFVDDRNRIVESREDNNHFLITLRVPSTSCDPMGGGEGGPETRSCFSGPDVYQGVDPDARIGFVCHKGQQVCDDSGAWGDCVGEVAPAASETCGDGLDNDCNGVIDDGCPEDCVPAAERPCWGGDASTRGVGACRDGVQTCLEGPGSARGHWSGACAGAVLPTVGDVCGDGQDDDCNGSVDDACEQPPVEPTVCGPGDPVDYSQPLPWTVSFTASSYEFEAWVVPEGTACCTTLGPFDSCETPSAAPIVHQTFTTAQACTGGEFCSAACGFDCFCQYSFVDPCLVCSKDPEPGLPGPPYRSSVRTCYRVRALGSTPSGWSTAGSMLPTCPQETCL
jgi:hypothetical protein